MPFLGLQSRRGFEFLELILIHCSLLVTLILYDQQKICVVVKGILRRWRLLQLLE
jgi:hypothetical protein